jgi:phosphoglycerate-specific signal transduction histidine kinase
MDAKTYLQQIEKSDKLIQNKLAELYQLRCLTTSISSAMKDDVVQTSRSGDKLADVVAKIIDLEREIDSVIDDFVDLKTECVQVIEQVSDVLQYNILHKHYVQYKSFVEIASEEGYTYPWILECHAKALKKVQDIIKEPIKTA